MREGVFEGNSVYLSAHVVAFASGLESNDQDRERSADQDKERSHGQGEMVSDFFEFVIGTIGEGIASGSVSEVVSTITQILFKNEWYLFGHESAGVYTT